MKTLFDKSVTEFDKYDKEHPDIWKQFVDIAMKLIRRGREHYGAKAIFEIIGYHRIITGNDEDEFKVNNNFTADYSRKFHKEFPMYDGFFETRSIKK